MSHGEAGIKQIRLNQLVKPKLEHFLKKWWGAQMREEDLHLGLGSKGWDSFRAVLNCKVQHNSNHRSPHSSYEPENRIFIWLGFQQHWILGIHRQERDLEKNLWIGTFFPPSSSSRKNLMAITLSKKTCFHATKLRLKNWKARKLM